MTYLTDAFFIAVGGVFYAALAWLHTIQNRSHDKIDDEFGKIEEHMLEDKNSKS